MSRYKPQVKLSTALSAVETFYDVCAELAEEVGDVVDSAEGGRAQTSRIQTLGETQDVLQGLDLPEVPDNCPDMELQVTIYVYTGKLAGRESRAARLANGVAYGRSGIGALSAFVEAERNKLEAEQQAQEVSVSGAKAREAELREFEDFCQAVEEHLDEAEGVEFPGMMG